MRKELEIIPMKNIDEREIRINGFCAKENKNEKL